MKRKAFVVRRLEQARAGRKVDFKQQKNGRGWPCRQIAEKGWKIGWLVGLARG